MEEKDVSEIIHNEKLLQKCYSDLKLSPFTDLPPPQQLVDEDCDRSTLASMCTVAPRLGLSHFKYESGGGDQFAMIRKMELCN